MLKGLEMDTQMIMKYDERKIGSMHQDTSINRANTQADDTLNSLISPEEEPLQDFIKGSEVNLKQIQALKMMHLGHHFDILETEEELIKEDHRVLKKLHEVSD